MRNNLTRQRDVEDKADGPSIVERFSIHGLYGYRTIAIDSPHAATILIARNGAGKTTLLSALNSFLRGHFTRLNGLDFREIRCKLRGLEKELVVKREELLDYLDLSNRKELTRYAQTLECEATTLFRFVSEEYPDLKDNYRMLSEHPIYTKIQRTIGYDSNKVDQFCARLSESPNGKNTKLTNVLKSIQRRMRNVDIIYLPTYRRIELPLTISNKEGKYTRRKAQPFRASEYPSLSADIQFGLQDISDRLSELNQTILYNSNSGYRRISANIISELIESDLREALLQSNESPQPEELSLFFSRVKEAHESGPFFEKIEIPNLESVYRTSASDSDSGIFLRYFLGKLNTVIKATKDIEAQVQEFIDNCNRYLSSQDQSTTLPDHQNARTRRPSGDDKILRLNRRNLKVHAESVIGERKISLDALSSGEKQMVSLFARLFLYPDEKVVLIDEPELSLSLGWQRQILVDVLAAPLCSQVIGITHSPFVFDNELEPFARTLEVIVDLNALPKSIDLNEDGE